MDGKMLLYRGSLKSCNYHCSYCPFSKHRMSKREMERDKGQWERFCQSLSKHAGGLGIRAMMVVPYGEALVHPWYWDGLARLSREGFIDAVGAQTNLSFSVDNALRRFCEAGGQIRKLRLWATFHPEMAAIGEFVEKCRKLKETGISFCVGVVGDPSRLKEIQGLRQALPLGVYLWVNKMDGLGRPYSAEEEKVFRAVDPYFMRELALVCGDASQCRGRLFVEGDGRMRTCNISQFQEQNWYGWIGGEPAADGAHSQLPPPVCGRKFCSCYLAYGGRGDMLNHVLFGPYPLFRIPRRAKAVFLDIDGTLLPKGRDTVPRQVVESLEALAKEARLFFATTMPFQEAIRRCGEIRHLFCGGIFAGGAHLYLDQGERRDFFYYINEGVVGSLGRYKAKYRYQILVYRNRAQAYKVTLCRSRHAPWASQEAAELFVRLPAGSREGLRYYIEGSCLQFVSVEADKEHGVSRMCRWLGISPEEAAAAGDAAEDTGMLSLCGGRLGQQGDGDIQ